MSNTTPSQPAVGGGDSPMQTALTQHKGYYVFLVLFLVLMSALGSFVNDMYTPALPTMCRFFGCSVPLGQMGLTMGMAGLAIGQIVLGPVSDRYGRRPVLIGSVILFTVAAVCSLFSHTIHEFNVWRLFQGIGASGGYFLARTIPADVYSGRPLAKLMALTGAINGVAPASAPVIGGVTADAFGWKGVFVVLALFALMILVCSPWVKESLARSRRVTVGPLRAFAGYKVLLTDRAFMTHVCLKGVALGLLFAYISATPFIMQNHYGLSETAYGLVIGFNALFMAAGAMAALKFRLLKRAATVGAVIVAITVAGVAPALWFVHSLVLFEVLIVVVMFGLGLIFTSANTLAMNEGRVKAGEASSVLGVAGYMVGAVVSPLVGMGNILHSTAIVFVVLALTVLWLSRQSKALVPDLQK